VKIRRRAWSLAVCAFLALASSINEAAAQDLEPRAYSASPIGTHFVAVGWARSTGDVLVDSAAPVQDITATTNLATIGGGTTFDFFGRTAILLAAFPYAWATASGQVGEETRSVSRSGLGDPRIKFSVNFIGGRALKRSEFALAERPTIVGASLAMAPPLGQYDPTKLVNLGANRWAFRPEVGISHAIRKWTIDGYAGVWLFTTNNEYYTGNSVRTQDPIYAFQGHASYTFKPRLWAAFDATWYSGGAAIVNGNDSGDLQRNSRIGATLSLPLTVRQSIKTSVTKGATTRVGADFTTLSVAWQVSWFD
jgi:hypothetical protein